MQKLKHYLKSNINQTNVLQSHYWVSISIIDWTNLVLRVSHLTAPWGECWEKFVIGPDYMSRFGPDTWAASVWAGPVVM